MGTTPLPTPPEPQEQGQAERTGSTFEAERSLIGNRAVTFRTHEVTPPSMLYITADDGLYVAIANLQAGQVITFAAQLLLPDGRLQPNVWTVTPTATGSPAYYLFNLAEGYLFNLTVTPAPNTRRGSTWLYVAIRRGSLAAGVNLQTLISDYVDSFSGPTWPGGTLKNSTEGTGLVFSTYVGNLPANQQAYNFVVPSYARVRVRAVGTGFQTSATVGNRRMTLFIVDPVNVIFLDCVEATQTASSYSSYYWALGLGWAQTAFVNAGVSRSLPDIILNAGQQVTLNVSGLSGDQFQGIYIVYEQWFSF